MKAEIISLFRDIICATRILSSHSNSFLSNYGDCKCERKYFIELLLFAASEMANPSSF